MPGYPIGVTGDLTDPLGIPGSVGFPVNVFASISPTILAAGKPVLTVGAIVATHGNPYNPHAPGFNPPCAVSEATTGWPTILVQGKPVATVGPWAGGTIAKCGHWLAGPGVPTIMIGSTTGAAS
jgi:uncharacterized Zn-binding protein involved in type VI secretion